MAIERERGFTLLEVLVALAVLSLALIALMRTATVQTAQFSALRERAIASWFAQDLLAETRLANALPPPGRGSGQRRFAGRDWHWEVEVQSTQAPTIRRLDVRIATVADPKDTVAQLTGFTGSDLAP